MTGTEALSKRAIAAIDLLRRTGAQGFEIRYSDDNTPVVWMAVVHYLVDDQGRPVAAGGTERYDAAAALDPEHAIYRLCDQMVDGGTCEHCHRPTGFVQDLSDMNVPWVCWYQWDPELSTFRRGCEGDQ